MRDHHGGFVAGASHFFPSVADPEHAELLACRRALELAKELGCERIVLETDCLNAVTKLRRPDKDRSAYGPLVEEIKDSCMGFRDVVISFVRRTTNEVAHKLAGEGCRSKSDLVWLGEPPGFVVNLLAAECDGS